MTEPKRYDAIVTIGEGRQNRTVVLASDFDRLRDERDTIRADLFAMALEAGEARRVAGVLADALRNAPCHCDHPLRAGLPPCSRCSALAVFDTLTEEKTRE